jgi:hypothetical protein
MGFVTSSFLVLDAIAAFSITLALGYPPTTEEDDTTQQQQRRHRRISELASR